MFNSAFHATRVLLVEDSIVNQVLLTTLLKVRNCEVTLATNGQEAVEKMAESEFEVVLMDVQMPVMDGLAATRLIRKREVSSIRHTPIIAVTAGMDRQSCLEAGMDDYLCKPVLGESLYKKLDQALTRAG